MYNAFILESLEARASWRYLREAFSFLVLVNSRSPNVRAGGSQKRNTARKRSAVPKKSPVQNKSLVQKKRNFRPLRKERAGWREPKKAFLSASVCSRTKRHKKKYTGSPLPLLVSAAVWLAFLFYKFCSCCRERKVKLSGPLLRSLASFFYTEFSWNISMSTANWNFGVFFLELLRSFVAHSDEKIGRA